jgi:hypothetical protein
VARSVDQEPRQQPDALAVDEVYEQAAGEIRIEAVAEVSMAATAVLKSTT